MFRELWSKAGASSLEDYVARMERLPSIFQNLVRSNRYHLSLAEEMYHQYFLSLTEDIQRILKLPKEQRLQSLLTSEQIDAIPDHKYLNELQTDNGIIALMEKLITLEEAVTMPTSQHLGNLLRDDGDGIVALREGLISPKQIAAMPSCCYIAQLLRDDCDGLMALRERLITPEQIAAMPSDYHVFYLFHRNLNDNIGESFGIRALREKLITPEQVAAIPHENLCLLAIYDNEKSSDINYIDGIVALREGLVTPEQVAVMPTDSRLGDLLNYREAYSKALRERLITPEQVAAMPTRLYLTHLLGYSSLYNNNDNGMRGLREGWITPEQIAALPSEKDIYEFVTRAEMNNDLNLYKKNHGMV